MKTLPGFENTTKTCMYLLNIISQNTSTKAAHQKLCWIHNMVHIWSYSTCQGNRNDNLFSFTIHAGSLYQVYETKIENVLDKEMYWKYSITICWRDCLKNIGIVRVAVTLVASYQINKN